MLGGVAEVVSSNPRWVIKYFSAFTGIADLLDLSISGLEKSSVLPVLDRFLKLKTDLLLDKELKIGP